jgi:hypothetical protein
MLDLHKTDYNAIILSVGTLDYTFELWKMAVPLNIVCMIHYRMEVAMPQQGSSLHRISRHIMTFWMILFCACRLVPLGRWLYLCRLMW